MRRQHLAPHRLFAFFEILRQTNLVYASSVSYGPNTIGATTSLTQGVAQLETEGFNLTLDCRSDAAVALVPLDPHAFSLILINLLDNATKFSARAEQKTIEIGCRAARPQVLFFWVRDYGSSITPGRARRVFRLFYRVDGGVTRQTTGTGIGLALVRQLAEAMGRTVEGVNPEPGTELRVGFRRVG